MKKELRWCGSSQGDMSVMPDGVKRQFGRKLSYLCAGELVSGTKPWNGCGPNGMEFASGGHRMVVTTEFEGMVYVLHAFKKDGPRGRKTRKQDSQTAVRRYAEICVDHAPRGPRH